jgi:4-hydroxy-3-methylbut-2-enyl diphosphate reductase
MYSAHGVSPAVRAEARDRQLQVIDATCPLVRKVHLEAARFAAQGYTIIYIGHAGHDEVVGTIGEAPDNIRLVETPDDVERLEVEDPAKVAYLTQTTLSVDDANLIIDRLKRRFPGCVGSAKEDICYATQNRQEALKALLPRADLVLVVGSANSSNTNRLAEVAREQGADAYLVDAVGDLDAVPLAAGQTVLLTAGASAPESIVMACVDFLRQHFGAEVENHSIRDELVEFPLPAEVR